MAARRAAALARPAAAAVPAGKVLAVIPEAAATTAAVPEAAGCPATAAVHAVPGTGQATQRRARDPRYLPSIPRRGCSSSGWA